MFISPSDSLVYFNSASNVEIECNAITSGSQSIEWVELGSMNHIKFCIPITNCSCDGIESEIYQVLVEQKMVKLPNSNGSFVVNHTITLLICNAPMRFNSIFTCQVINSTHYNRTVTVLPLDIAPHTPIPSNMLTPLDPSIFSNTSVPPNTSIPPIPPNTLIYSNTSILIPSKSPAENETPYLIALTVFPLLVLMATVAILITCIIVCFLVNKKSSISFSSTPSKIGSVTLPIDTLEFPRNRLRFIELIGKLLTNTDSKL